VWPVIITWPSLISSTTFSSVVKSPTIFVGPVSLIIPSESMVTLPVIPPKPYTSLRQELQVKAEKIN
jgi:hypothetical protein